MSVGIRTCDYDPATGQFLTRDPIEAITRSAYGYAGNDPINRIDPTGQVDIPGWVPVVGGKCIDIADPDCDSPMDETMQHVKDAVDWVIDDTYDDWVPFTPRKLFVNLASYSAGVLTDIGCGLATASLGWWTLVCHPIGYGAKQLAEAFTEWCLDQTGRVDIDMPIKWPTTFTL